MFISHTIPMLENKKTYNHQDKSSYQIFYLVFIELPITLLIRIGANFQSPITRSRLLYFFIPSESVGYAFLKMTIYPNIHVEI